MGGWRIVRVLTASSWWSDRVMAFVEWNQNIHVFGHSIDMHWILGSFGAGTDARPRLGISTRIGVSAAGRRPFGSTGTVLAYFFGFARDGTWPGRFPMTATTCDMELNRQLVGDRNTFAWIAGSFRGRAASAKTRGYAWGRGVCRVGRALCPVSNWRSLLAAPVSASRVLPGFRHADGTVFASREVNIGFGSGRATKRRCQVASWSTSAAGWVRTVDTAFGGGSG